jgi:hypothetical protein
MVEHDTAILLGIVAVNLALVSALLWMRMRASGQKALATRLIIELWLTFALAFVLFRSMQRMLGGEAPLREPGVFAGLEHTAKQFAALGPAAKALFAGGGLVALGLLIHLIVSISRAGQAPLKPNA